MSKLKLIILFSIFITTHVFAEDDEQELNIGINQAPSKASFGRGMLDVLPNETQKDATQIKETHATTVVDLLRQDSSVTVQGGGVPGLLPSLFIRGASSDHALLLWNGIELNDLSSPGGAGDPSFFNREFSHQLRILKGPQTLLYGSSALGGVIMLDRDANAGSQIKVAAGTMDNAEGLYELQHRNQESEIAIGGRLFQVRGLSAYDNGVRPLEKDARVEGSVSLMAQGKVKDNVTFKGLLSHAENRTDDDAPPVDDPNAFTQQKQDAFVGSFIFDFSPQLHSEIQVSRARLQRLSQNDPDSVSSSSYKDDVSGYLNNVRNINRWENQHWLTQFGFDLRNESAMIGVQSVNQDKQAIFWLQEFRGENFDMAYGVREDCKDGTTCETVGQLTLQKHFLDLAISPYAMLATGLKRPSMYQLYSANYGQINLSSEHALSLEIGVQWRHLLEQEFKFGIFDSSYRDLVDFNSSTSKYYNINRVRIQGIESQYLKRQNWGQWEFGYTQLIPRDEVQLRDLLRRPRQKLNLAANYRLNDDWQTRIEGNYMSSREDMSGSSRVDMPEYWIWNGVFMHHLKKSNVSLRVNNFNNSAADFALGYPIPRVNLWMEYQQDL